MPVVDPLRRALLVGSMIGVSIGGCSTVGPVSIDQGRTPYNEVIQTTSEQQTLLNLVRVSKAETPLFMDVTEVDAVTTAQVNVMGTESGLGSILNRTSSAGTLATSVGSVTAGAQYQESPTVRYQPLLGAALVAQVSTPISATSIVNLYDSGWPLGSIFDLAVSRFTPGYDDYHVALDALMTLDRYGALVLEARPPGRRRPTTPGVARTDASAGPPSAKDADLVIHFVPVRLRHRFGRCDVGVDTDPRQAQVVAEALWTRVVASYPGAGRTRSLVLSATAGPDDPARSRGDGPPLLQTRSALGVMNTIAAGDNLVRFAPKDDVDETIDATNAVTGDAGSSCHQSFYRAGDLNREGTRKMPGEAADFENRRYTRIGDVLTAEARERERVFGDDRRLILVEVTAARPADAFVSVLHRGAWYSIQDRDLISKRNLALVAQIATIQAVAPQSGPLTPTIVVGGR